MLLALVPLVLLMQSQTPLDRARELIEVGKLAEGRAAVAGLDPEQPEVA